MFANEIGFGGKVLWRPDSEDLGPIESCLSEVKLWEKTELVSGLIRYNEIPIEEGTKKIAVTQVSMNASPALKPTRE